MSPDSQWVGFFRSRELHKINLATGAQVQLATFAQPGLSGSWSERGFIIVTIGSSLLRLSEDGGEPEPLIEPEPGNVPRINRVEALPGGEAALIETLRSGICRRHPGPEPRYAFSVRVRSRNLMSIFSSSSRIGL